MFVIKMTETTGPTETTFVQSVQVHQAEHETIESAVREFRSIADDYRVEEIVLSMNSLLICKFDQLDDKPLVVTFWIEHE